MTQPDLFLDTRLEAKPTDLGAAKLRRLVLAAYRGAGPSGLTADQASAAAGLTPFAGRPRVTELKQSGFLECTGEKRRNASGMWARVLRSVK